LQTYPGADKSL